MLTKNGIILNNSYSGSAANLVGTLKNFSGENINSGTFSNAHFLLLPASNVTNNYFRFVSSADDVTSASYVYLSVGYREGEVTQDTYEPVFDSDFSMTVTTSNKYSVVILTNISNEAVTVNEVDLMVYGGSGSAKILGAVFSIDEVTLEPGESISFSFLHT